jgi:hypothetical protein
LRRKKKQRRKTKDAGLDVIEGEAFVINEYFPTGKWLQAGEQKTAELTRRF